MATLTRPVNQQLDTAPAGPYKSFCQYITEFFETESKTAIKTAQNAIEWMQIAEANYDTEGVIKQWVDLSEPLKVCKTSSAVCGIVFLPGHLKKMFDNAYKGNIRAASVDLSKIGCDLIDMGKLAIATGASAMSSTGLTAGKDALSLYGSINGTLDTGSHIYTAVTSETQPADATQQRIQSYRNWALGGDFLYNAATGTLNCISLAPFATGVSLATLVGVTVSSIIMTSLGTTLLVGLIAKFYFNNVAEQIAHPRLAGF